MDEKKIARYQALARYAQLAMIIMGAIAAFDWLGGVIVFGKTSITHIFAGAATIAGLLAKWSAAQLPAASELSDKPPSTGLTTLVIMLALGLMAAAGCKVPPLAAAYRSHALLVQGRDGAGEMLAKTQRAKMEQCERDHKPGVDGWQAKLKACYEGVRKPVAAWVQHIKPALTAAADALWLALESAWIAEDTKLSKTEKAMAVACKALTAAETTLSQYKDQMGDAGKLVLGAVSGGKVLVCK